jgi:hypothetical protein
MGAARVQIAALTVDVCVLEAVVAFRDRPSGPRTLRDFVKTTFLNVDAVAVPLDRARRVVETGFMRGLREQTLDLQYVPNVNPAGAAVKAVVCARRYGFTMTPSLRAYVGERLAEGSLTEAITETKQRTRYGAALAPWTDFIDCIGSAP